MARPNNGGPNTIDRWEGEGSVAHRSMLLWACQRPAERSFRCVARAAGKSDSVIRRWAVKYSWEERSSKPGSEEGSVVLYRRDYMSEYGKQDWQHVKHLCSFSLSVNRNAPAPSVASEAISKSREGDIARTIEATIPVKSAKKMDKEAEKVEKEIERIRKAQAAALNREEQILEAGLMYAVGRMKEKEVRVSLRDIPMLLEAKRNLQQVRVGTVQTDSAKGARAPAPESARVRHAKVSGGSVLQAMLDDTEELQVILSALVTKEDLQIAQEGQEPKEELKHG